MAQSLAIICQVCGGLGIFLLGMKNMSEGMQAVAGERLRKMIGAVTNNRFMACGLGTLVTMIIQSSSVTTVMVVGLVNAGIMTLIQAIGVIFGANIGTTITAWILVINLGKYGLPLLGISAFFYLFTKRDRIRFSAMFLMGIGMVFFGLELMKNGFDPIKDMPSFVSWFHRFHPEGYWGIWKCILAGAVLTATIQSSSATIGITLGLAFTGIIDYPTAAALVLGENIGTTITAWLASLGAGSNARRAAYAHILFNTLGVCWISLVFPWYTLLVSRIVTITQTRSISAIVSSDQDDSKLGEYARQYKIDESKLYFTDSEGHRKNREGADLDEKIPYVLAEDFERAIENTNITTLTAYTGDQTHYPFTQAAIAFTHSGFNILNTLAFLPLLGIIARLLTRLIPEKKTAEKPHLTYLNVRMLDTPAIGIQQSQKEVIRMGEMVRQMLDKLETMLSNEEPNRVLADEIFQLENDLDVMQMEIVGFLGDILSGNIAHEVIVESRHQIRTADEYESISDYITAILKLRLKMRDTHLLFSSESIEEIRRLHTMAKQYFELIHMTFERDQGSAEFFSEAQIRGMAVTKYMKECRSRHMARVEAGKVSPMKSLIYTDMLSSYRRIKDHAFNVAEVIVGEK